MKGLLQAGINHILRYTRVHMAAGAAALAVAAYLIMTGRYDNLAAVNGFVIAALLYVVGIWYVNLFLSPGMTEAAGRHR